MNRKKSLIIASAIAATGLIGLGGAGLVSAATDTSSSDSLVDKIATKFNLKKADVQAVFDQDQAERQAEREADFSDHLQSLVDDGKISAAQKTLIENKHKELEAARKTEMDNLKTWASQNNVDLKYLMGGPRGESSDRLQSLVDDGKITAAQKTLIENKQAELKTAREAKRTELQKWATDNGIDVKYVRGGFGGSHHGPGGPMDDGPNDTSSSSSADDSVDDDSSNS